MAPDPNFPATRLRGVNLGGWLVMEKWMKPSLFAGLGATDETTWCAELGRAAPERLRAHWDSFITREDFAWLAAASATRRGRERRHHPRLRGPGARHLQGDRVGPLRDGDEVSVEIEGLGMIKNKVKAESR